MSKIVYHGSPEADLEEIQWNSPGYEGGIGSGVYVTENFKTAKFYGNYVYALYLEVSDTEILNLDAYEQNQFPTLEGTSILMGEFIPPFWFTIRDKKYAVGIDAIPEDIESFLGSLYEYVDPPVAQLIEANIIKKFDYTSSIPSEATDWDDRIADIVFELYPDSDNNTIDTITNETLDKLQDSIDDYQAQRVDMIMIDLADIGDIAEENGYKAVYFERANVSAADELLVLSATYLTMIGPVDNPIEKNDV